jgi:phage gp46-like protein
VNLPYVDPNTGNYTLVNGNILNQDATLTRMIFRLKTPKGTYIFNKPFGNELMTKVGTRFNANKKTLEQWVKNSLQDLVTDGTLTTLAVICTLYTYKAASFKIYATDSANKQIELPWSLDL